jgi:glycosyltransferase involved in cell wall biosynthesis
LTESIRKELPPLPDDPTVSILTNCKNGARTVRKCIEGVLAQNYPRREYVFQDGGSTDGTLDIVKEYMSRYPGRIRLNQEPDSCPEEGFFRGLKICKGEIIATSMVDEEMLPEAIARGVEELKRLPQAGAVYGDVYLTDAEGRITSTWIPTPFSLEGFLCSEVMPAFAASFFRRDALLGAGLLTRNWIWGIGEYEFWLRIGAKYAVHHFSGTIAKYAFHPGTSSYNILSDDEKFVATRKAFLDRLFAEPDLPESLRRLEKRALGGLHLFIGEVLLSFKEYPKAQKHLQKAVEYQPNPALVLDLAQKLARAGLNWDAKMLRNNISAHLKKLSPQRIVCYGAGNDFRELLSSGVFDGHTVAAVVDNHRPKGSFVGGVPVIPEADMGQVDHDVVVVTSSKWAHEFRTSSARRALENSPTIPVI